MKCLIQFITATAILAILVGGDQPLSADIVWDEAVDGDLSDNPNAPTLVNFSNGLNTVIGTLSEPDGDERDYLTFTLGPNQFLTGLILDALDPTGVEFGVSFQAINAGNIGFIPGDDPSENFLGFEFVSPFMVGQDMLPDLAVGLFGSTGFSIPLGPGNYTYLIQELTPGEFRSYQLTFVVVPEPSTIGLFGLSSLWLFARRIRRTP